MSDLFKNTSISKFNRSDPSYIRVNESGVSRSRDREKNVLLQYKGKSINSLSLLYARVMQILEEKSNSDDSTSLSHLRAGEREFYSLLFSLSNSFLILASTDTSTNTDFINKLSSTWNFLMLSVNRRQKRKHPPEYIDLLNSTFELIKNFGQDEGEPLGYYLEAHKKSDWFPIPYLEMLSNLHEDSIEHGSDSNLRIWQENIQHLLNAILTSS